MTRALPPPFVFLAALCLGLALRHFRPEAVFASAAVADVLGGVLIVLGLALNTLTVVYFRRSETPVSPLRPSRRLVVSGPYRFSRNPDYLGQTCLYTGIAFLLNSVWVVFGLVPALVVVRYVVFREERYLSSLFGAEYAEYLRRVRRWL